MHGQLADTVDLRRCHAPGIIGAGIIAAVLEAIAAKVDVAAALDRAADG